MSANNLFCRKVKLIVVLIMIMVFAFGCDNNDDFAPYTHYTKELESSLSIEEVNKIIDIMPDAENIARSYTAEPVLTSVDITTENPLLTGSIQFGYFEGNETKNQVTVVNIYYDVGNRVFNKIEYEQGHGKRVSYISEQIGDKYIVMNFEDLFAAEEFEEYKTGDTIKIHLSFNRMEVYTYKRQCVD